MPSVRENKNSSEERQQAIQLLVDQFQALYPPASAQQLPDLARALSLNNTNVSFHLAVIALITQLVRLKTILNSRIKDSLLPEIGQQALDNIVLLTNKALFYRVQYSAHTHNINLLLNKMTAHTACLTATMTSLDELDTPSPKALLLLSQSEKRFEQAIHSYANRLPFIISDQNRQIIKERKNQLYGAIYFLFCTLVLLGNAIMPPFIFLQLLVFIVPSVVFAGLCLRSAHLAYNAHKMLKAEQNNQQRNYQNKFPLNPQQEALKQLSDFQKLKQGQDLLRNNKLDKALHCFSQIPESNKNIYAQAMYESGYALLVRKQYQRATHYFIKAGDLDTARQTVTFHHLSQIEETEEKPTDDQRGQPSSLGLFHQQSGGTVASPQKILPDSQPSTHKGFLLPLEELKNVF